MTLNIELKMLQRLREREKLEDTIEEYFKLQKFDRVKTPLLVPCPGMEPHIRPMELKPRGNKRVFLPTSPEFAMKKLLVKLGQTGLAKIFQICPAFRSEPHSQTHLGEFTMLEWYRLNETLLSIQKDVENLILHIAHKLVKKNVITYQSQTIDLTPPWPVFTVRELFKSYAHLDLKSDTSTTELLEACKMLKLQAPNAMKPSAQWNDLFFLIWLNAIEPKLPLDRPCFVKDYPASLAALSVVEKGFAQRFEFFIGGLEMGNAYQELTDTDEHIRRFKHEMQIRAEIYGPHFPPNPIDEELIVALRQGLPPCSGIAVGVDRLAMIFLDTPNIQDTLWHLPLWEESQS